MRIVMRVLEDKACSSPENYLFVLVNLTIFLDSVLYGIIVPVVPHYATALGASPAQLGVIFAAYSAGLLLFGIPAGIACDRYGYKPPLVLGMAGLTLATIAFAFSGRIWLLAASRLVQGIAGAVTWTAAMAVVAALYPARRLGQRMGIMMTSGGIGTIVGPALGGAFYQFAGYAAPFLAVALAGTVLGVLLWFSRMPETGAGSAEGNGEDNEWEKGNGRQNEGESRSGHPWGSRLKTEFRPLLHNRKVGWVLLVIAAGSSGFGMIEPLLPLALEKRFGLNSAGIGLLFGAFSFFLALAQPFFGALSDRLGRKPPLIGGLLCTTVLVPWLALAPNIQLETAVLILLGVATGAYFAPTMPLLAESTAGDSPANGRYGTTYGLSNTAYSLGLVAGPVAGTLIAQRWGLLAALLAYSALLLLVAAGAAARLQETLKKK
ncbi:MAG: MFS transporter [Armatimonadetes bacterium]|nr:MFS transporter [Armatimonadota bacterium]